MRRPFGLNRNVFFLGMVSLLTDVSTELIFTLLPLFLRNVLMTPFTIVGLVGGVSESADSILRIFSGWLSDRVRKRKLLAVVGYSLSTLAKPFMYLATSWASVLAIRFGDRLGKGIRTAPRDALVADSVTDGERGRGFGLHRAMDTSGAVLGLALAAVIIYAIQGGELELSLKTYQWLILAGVVPAVMAVMVLLFFVRERKPPPPTQKLPLLGSVGGFSTRFKLFLVVMALFTLGNSSDFFVILRAQNLGASVFWVTLMLVLFNLTYALTALPAGVLSDRLGRRQVIAIGWSIYGLVYLGLALASSPWQVWLLFAGYGFYYGMAEGAARAFVADLVPIEKRGTAYGLYHGVVGITLLPASLIAGWLWQVVGPSAPFYFGATLAFLGMVGIMGLVRR